MKHEPLPRWWDGRQRVDRGIVLAEPTVAMEYAAGQPAREARRRLPVLEAAAPRWARGLTLGTYLAQMNAWCEARQRTREEAEWG